MLNRNLVVHARKGASLALTKVSLNVTFPPRALVWSIRPKPPIILCINKSRGQTIYSYMQKDEKTPVKLNVEPNRHGIQRTEFNENNVSVQKLKLGQGRDPGVRSTPFVKQGEGVRSKQFGNVTSDNFYAKSEDVYAYQKNRKKSETAEEQKVSENVTYVENASVEKV